MTSAARLSTVVLSLLALAAPAVAQTQSDPIGAILDRPGHPTPEMDEPDMASQPLSPEPAPTVVAPFDAPNTPQPYTPPAPAPRLSAPVNIDELGKTPEAPPTVTDLAYESRIRSSMASAQGFQGPMDGSWTLSGPEGDLYALQLADRGKGVVEGAWRDLRRPGAVGASGFVDQIAQTGSDLTLRFGPATVQLSGGYGGRWAGELDDRGRRQHVTLRKVAP